MRLGATEEEKDDGNDDGVDDHEIRLQAPFTIVPANLIFLRLNTFNLTNALCDHVALHYSRK